MDDRMVLLLLGALVSAAVGYLVHRYRMRARPFVSLLFVEEFVDDTELFFENPAPGAASRPGASPAGPQKMMEIMREAWILPEFFQMRDLQSIRFARVKELIETCHFWDDNSHFLDEDIKRWIDALRASTGMEETQAILTQSLSHPIFNYVLFQAAIRHRLDLDGCADKEETPLKWDYVAFAGDELGASFMIDFDNFTLSLGQNLESYPFAESRVTPLLNAVCSLDTARLVPIYEQAIPLFWHQQNMITQFREFVETEMARRKRWLAHFSIANLGAPMLLYKDLMLRIEGGGIRCEDLKCALYSGPMADDAGRVIYQKVDGKARLLSGSEITRFTAASRPFGKIGATALLSGAFHSGRDREAAPQTQLCLQVRGPEQRTPREVWSDEIAFVRRDD